MHKNKKERRKYLRGNVRYSIIINEIKYTTKNLSPYGAAVYNSKKEPKRIHNVKVIMQYKCTDKTKTIPIKAKFSGTRPEGFAIEFRKRVCFA